MHLGQILLLAGIILPCAAYSAPGPQTPQQATESKPQDRTLIISGGKSSAEYASSGLTFLLGEKDKKAELNVTLSDNKHVSFAVVVTAPLDESTRTAALSDRAPGVPSFTLRTVLELRFLGTLLSGLMEALAEPEADLPKNVFRNADRFAIGLDLSASFDRFKVYVDGLDDSTTLAEPVYRNSYTILPLPYLYFYLNECTALTLLIGPKFSDEFKATKGKTCTKYTSAVDPTRSGEACDTDVWFMKKDPEAELGLFAGLSLGFGVDRKYGPRQSTSGDLYVRYDQVRGDLRIGVSVFLKPAEWPVSPRFGLNLEAIIATEDREDTDGGEVLFVPSMFVGANL